MIDRVDANYTERNAFRDELAAILGSIDRVPAVFSAERTKVLMIGAREALLERFPDIDETLLKDWLARWCSCQSYLKATAYKNHRHDLDGNDVSDIQNDSRLHARWRLFQIKNPEAAAANAAARAKKKPKAGSDAGAAT